MGYSSTQLQTSRQADLFTITNATDIHGTAFDNATNPIALNGTLNSTITPANYVSFVSYVNQTQLSRFGLHDGEIKIASSCVELPIIMVDLGDPDDPTLIDAKWESLALAPCDDPKYPDDYFLFTAVSS